MSFWKYDKVDTRDDVTVKLPDNAKLEVYKTVSGDSGKIYYIQVLTLRSAPHYESGIVLRLKPQIIYLCNCPEGTFRAPLSILGLECPCKHAEHLAEYLKEMKR